MTALVTGVLVAALILLALWTPMPAPAHAPQSRHKAYLKAVRINRGCMALCAVALAAITWVNW